MFPIGDGGVSLHTKIPRNSTEGASAQGILKNSDNGVSAHACARNLVPYILQKKNKGQWSITTHGDPQKLHQMSFCA